MLRCLPWPEAESARDQASSRPTYQPCAGPCPLPAPAAAEVASLAQVAPRAFDVATKDGARYEADAVVNCCGLWSQTLSAALGLEQTHPAFVIEHHYAARGPRLFL